MALVPFRAPGHGKTRLATRDRAGVRGLTPAERAALAAAMLSDVAAALTGAPVDQLVVAASDAAAATAASALGLAVVVDPPAAAGLDHALDAAARRTVQEGTLLVVAADLPCLQPAEVEAVLTVRGAVVVAPTTDGGTGGLLRRPPTAVPTAYGPRSAERHLALAAARGLPAARVELDGFRHDVDTWADLAALHQRRPGPATAAFLDRIAGRLTATA
ncbi:MAG TPA: 2-phospho-L-lactate guanylyltransferase [Nitriliruptorales bacterium]|nr:2-phospho-L-lactate guanylyltransferase [Nitriliruptorales bacterium]